MVKKLTNKDEVLEHLEECHNRFKNRVRSYGYESIEEWKENHLYPTPTIDRINRYPVHSDN